MRFSYDRSVISLLLWVWLKRLVSRGVVGTLRTLLRLNGMCWMPAAGC
jgi:Gpi18-like mannosyltransferase